MATGPSSTTPRPIPPSPLFGGTVTQSDQRRPPTLEPPTLEESVIAPLADHPTIRPAARVPSAAARWCIALLLLWLLVGPRVDLPSALHGLRVEDLVLAALALLCLLHGRIPGRPTAPTVGIIVVVATGIVSALVSSLRGMVNPLDAALFAVRPLEYWIAFPAVLLLLRGQEDRWARRFERGLAVVTVLQTGFAVAQYYFNIPVGFSHAAYTRAAGLTVGPYELGAISAALIVYWISQLRWTMASLAGIALAASISRISVLGAVAGVAVLVIGSLIVIRRRIKSEGRNEVLRVRRSRLRIVADVSSVAVAAVVLAYTVGVIHLPVPNPGTESGQVAADAPAQPSGSDSTPSTSVTPPPDLQNETLPAPSDSVAQRLQSTSVIGNWIAADSIAARVPHPRNSGDYQFEAYAGMNIYLNANTAADAGADESNLVRFFRWHLILDTMNDPLSVIFGLGPSYVGPSVDGSYLRMYADGGILGVIAWIVLIVAWLRRRPLWMICVTISMLVGGLFIDILYSERPMVLFWALLALAFVWSRLQSARPGRPAASDDPRAVAIRS